MLACRTRTRKAAQRGPAAPVLCGCGPRCRTGCRGTGRTSRPTRRAYPSACCRAGCSRDACRCRSGRSIDRGPALTRDWSVCGSAGPTVSRRAASAISLSVRWRTKIGLPCHIDRDALAGRDRRQIDFDRGHRQHVLGRVHRADQAQAMPPAPDRGAGAGDQFQQVTFGAIGAMGPPWAAMRVVRGSGGDVDRPYFPSSIHVSARGAGALLTADHPPWTARRVGGNLEAPIPRNSARNFQIGPIALQHHRAMGYPDCLAGTSP